MKKILIYLHGFGYDKNENKVFQQKLAKALGADLLAIDAQIPSGRPRGGLRWYDRDAEKANGCIGEEILTSEEYVNSIINKEIKERNISKKDVVLCGRSQGALLSIVIGLTSKEPFYAIIPIAGFFYDNIPGFKLNNDSKIIWIETRLDIVLDDKKKESYKILKELNANIKVFVDENSDHDILDGSIIDIIKGEIK